MGYLDYAGLQYFWGKLKEKFAPKSHSHDDRYYTEAEMDGKLSGKADNTRAGANDLINKLDSGTAAPVDDDLIITQWANHTTAAAANKNQYVRRPMSSIWNYIKGKTDGAYQPKGSYAASEHTHDDRYYTEAEIDGKLTEKLHEETITDARDLNTIKTTGVYHLKTTSYTNGPGISNHATIFVDYTVGTPYQIFIPDSVNRAWRRNYVNSNDTWYAWTELKYTDTNTWRGIQNNLTSDSTSDSLSAAQGKALKTLIDGKAASVHTHTKDQVGLGNVDNTADVNKSVKYATSAGSASTATKANIADSTNALSGLSSRSSQGWGIQTGTFIHGEGDTTGGDFAFRRDCPNAGQLSMVLDGRFYQNEGQYRVLDESDKNQFATAGHTHNYAGSSSAGGSATSAVKLDSSAGSNTQPVYFSGGKPVAIGYTIASSVPANAKFTDTTYGVATASSNGLMSSTDKTKLDDFSRVISIRKQIKLTTDWQDTGIAGTSFDTGTYIIQVSGFNSSYTSLYSEIYSGIMTWYASETNDLNNDEIFLHNAGHASNSNDIYLRTSRRMHGNGGLHLQIACKVAASGTDTLTFKFRRLI